MNSKLNLTEKLELILKPKRVVKRELTDSNINRANQHYKKAGDITGIYFEVTNSDTD
jgi:hypothetical protein